MPQLSPVVLTDIALDEESTRSLELRPEGIDKNGVYNFKQIDTSIHEAAMLTYSRSRSGNNVPVEKRKVTTKVNFTDRHDIEVDGVTVHVQLPIRIEIGASEMLSPEHIRSSITMALAILSSGNCVSEAVNLQESFW